MKQRRTKQGRFTSIENEREQQRKLYEENLRKKKEMLYFEFEKQEEVLKYTKLSVETHNDVNFKYEHDRVTNIRIEKENQLQDLLKTLKDAQEINKMQEPLPEGQSLYGQANKGINLTSIFSKSFYRSSGLQILTSTQMKSRDDVNNYIAYMNQEIEQVNENLKNEEQRTLTLKKSMQELFKTKQKFRDQLHDLEFLNETADRRFHDLAAVQFKAKEKKIAIDKDLNAAKKSLKEYQQIGDKYKEKQMVKMKSGEKIKKTAEEIISHDMIRQDELEKEIQMLQQVIQKEVIKQQTIIEKRSESKYILKYIDCFTQFERLFLSGEVKEKDIQDLYEFNNINRRSILSQHQQNLSDDGSTINLQSHNLILNAHRSRKDSRMSSGDSRSPTLSPTRDRMRSSFNIQEEDNRRSLIDTINKFDSEHPNGARDLVNEMIKMYNNYSYIQETLNGNHSRLLEEKARKQQELIDLENNLNNIKKFNQYLDEMENNKQFEKQMLELTEAVDSGLLTIPQSENKINGAINQNTNNHHNKEQKQLISTVNILKHDNFQHESEKIKELAQKNQNFIFNFFSNYCESVIRVCQILELIFGFSLNLCPVQLEKLSKSTIQFIKDIWAGKFEENLDPLQKKNNKRSRQTIIYQKLGTQELLNGEEQPVAYFKHIESEKFTHEEIRNLFTEIFPHKHHLADSFFSYIKSERIIWFFCNLEQISNYLNDQRKQNGEEKGAQLALDNIHELKEQGLAIFQNKLQNLMELMIKIHNQIKDSSHNCIKYIRETYPDYNPYRRYTQKQVRENDEIREAKLKATQKSDNYFRNNDPLMEDFIILKKEDAYNILIRENSSDQEKQQLQQLQQKKQEDKNQDQINMLIEYIKKTKNNGQQILIEQKKQQVMQMQKNKQKNQFSQQESIQSQQQINNGIIHTVSSQEGSNVLYQRNQSQMANTSDFSSGNQPQQISTVNAIQSSQDSSNKLYLSSVKEDITRFKQLNKGENETIQKERERIHNLSKQKQIDELLEIERQLQQKNNKFFVSNEITSINDRLHQEKNAPFKEKLIRNFSESQLVLSKVDRMDRFSGFIGPQVVNKIQEEKNQMVRALRGELYQPDLNYLKSNNAYNVRKQVAMEQLNFLHDQKLKQTVLLNHSSSQSIQSSSKKNDQNQFSFNKDTHSKQKKSENQNAAKTDILLIKDDKQLNEQQVFNQQLSHFHPMKHQSKVDQITIKREQPSDEKSQQKEILQQKLKDIKTTLKLPSANSTRLQTIDSRPQTQGSNNYRKIKKQEFLVQDGFSNKKSNLTLSGQNFYSNKLVRDTSANDLQYNRKAQTPINYNNFGLSDVFSSETSFTQNPNSVGPYNNQNLKFYQRYASPEGDAFFDQILNGPPFYNLNNNQARPMTQQNTKAQQKYQMKNNEYNYPINEYNLDQVAKPQSSHEGKRNLFYKQQQQFPQQQKYNSNQNQNQQDQILEEDQQREKRVSFGQESEHFQVQQQNKQIEIEEFGQMNSNRQTDIYSTVSQSSSRTNNTHINRLSANQKHDQEASQQNEQ
ncbi:hypothetical protein TTHERM_00392650 (macronuclear) [Tetrahymena thermophila SB210]|uniref:Uncharacterized protein n=1 Tax=Tetrahymena thermophila (strain SB210) TaxID=312017 RepID=Q233I4_TETTS|nr:hypothetical protein TTHERM_00392650 [Tetrahymena thermophila SB210]EAR91596.1 hypothetical protein TTHERM_00392650 [Tetrahymena thermophila SB210]|eukprot:XP_001011841.1 hypothetical protein TTHERM_00392650 [Tetrahymena thermophila SB210]